VTTNADIIRLLREGEEIVLQYKRENFDLRLLCITLAVELERRCVLHPEDAGETAAEIIQRVGPKLNANTEQETAK
jgi:hypothetical protein